MNRYRLTRVGILILMLTTLQVGPSRADIFQWEYINPADPSQGKQQSTTLCPDGAGVTAEPHAGLWHRNLTRAYLFEADLDSGSLYDVTLSDAYLRQANLSNADLRDSSLTYADLTDSVVVGASFAGTTSRGFTKEQLYSTASYKNHDLSRIDLASNDLTGWSLAGQNLTNASLGWSSGGDSTLTDADLTDSVVVGANFLNTTPRGFTKEQLYSTASYKNCDLSGIDLAVNDLTGWNFAGQNLTDANFYYSTLSDADLTGAVVVGASFESTTWIGFTKEQLYSTVSFQNHDLSGIDLGGNDLAGWDFAGQNLTNADFGHSQDSSGWLPTDLTDVDLTDAIVVGASFGYTTPGSFTKEQLYSTASYQNHDLQGIDLANNDLTGRDFAGQNLTNATFCFWGCSTLNNADFRGADTRGTYLESSTAIVGNTILSDGRIDGVDLTAGEMLVVRDYDGRPPTPWNAEIPPLPIHVDDHFTIGLGGLLQMQFEADAWDSTISFEPGIPVTLGGGTLKLGFADGVNLASQRGRTFHVFDWTGVELVGEFNIVSPYEWDASLLYSAGEVTFVGVPETSSLMLLALGIPLLLVRKHR